MLVGSGGNAGNQPGVAVTRMIATGEIKGNVMRLLRKEFLISLITASAVGGTGFLRVYIAEGDYWSAMSIGISLWVVVFISVFLGIFFSLLIDKLGGDPAAGAAAMVTTISDLLGITILCVCSWLVFAYLSPCDTPFTNEGHASQVHHTMRGSVQ